MRKPCLAIAALRWPLSSIIYGVKIPASRVGAEELFATFDSDSVDEWLIKLNLQHLFAELGGKPPQI
jgi:hypothetical protein